MEIEIVEEPSKGFLGLGSRKAIVRLTLKTSQVDHPLPVSPRGVGVKNGTLFLIPPDTKGGNIPVIRFSSEFHVLYRGETVTKEVELTHGLDSLEVNLPPDREPELRYEIATDTKKVRAELVWKKIPGVKYSLQDHPVTNILTLRLAKNEIKPPGLTLKDVEELVRVEGLTYGLKIADLTEETLAASQGTHLIAVGRTPGETIHPFIKYVFKESGTDVDDDALRIDYYEVHGTEGVHEGAVLAVKDPGRLGAPGVDVYGKPIASEPLKKLDLVIGEGVRLSEDGLHAIATTSGLPSLRNGMIRVTDVYELAGDADVSTGNITMDGDIIIRGNVLENIKVQSKKGVIVVQGLVSGGTLRAGGSITVLRNVVRAQLHSGGVTVSQIRTGNLLRKISSQLEALEVAYEAIVRQAENVPFENLIRHLIELKFHALPEDIKSLGDEISKIEQESESDGEKYANLIKTIDRYVVPRGSGFLTINDAQELRQLRREIKARIEELESESPIEADVEVGYLQNSHIEASGSVAVKGKGCFYSTVLAGKNFSIAGGVFRGGQVTVNSGSIVAKELGGPKGIATIAKIVGTGSISASLVHPNVTVVIGHQSYKFSETTSMVKVYFHDNILTVYSGSNKIHG